MYHGSVKCCNSFSATTLLSVFFMYLFLMTKSQYSSISVNGVKFFYAGLACDPWSSCIHFRNIWLSNLYFLVVCLAAGMVAVGEVPVLWTSPDAFELIVLEHKASAAPVEESAIPLGS